MSLMVCCMLCATIAVSAIFPAIVHAVLLWGFTLDGYPITEERLKTLTAETGMRPGLIVFFLQWPPPGDSERPHFPEESLRAIEKTGAIPCITWEPMHLIDGKEVVIEARNILKGDYDRYIVSFARAAKLWGKPFMVRFAHEMNIERYHWGVEKREYGPESAALYRDMYRYVVSIFRAEGARNVLWVFCPNAESLPNASYDATAGWNVMRNYYPGDEYVDVLGIDGTVRGNHLRKFLKLLLRKSVPSLP